jgi:hypothetical protein
MLAAMGLLGVPQGQMDSRCHVLKEDLQQSIGMLVVTSHLARCRGTDAARGSGRWPLIDSADPWLCNAPSGPAVPRGSPMYLWFNVQYWKLAQWGYSIEIEGLLVKMGVFGSGNASFYKHKFLKRQPHKPSKLVIYLYLQCCAFRPYLQGLETMKTYYINKHMI